MFSVGYVVNDEMITAIPINITVDAHLCSPVTGDCICSPHRVQFEHVAAGWQDWPRWLADACSEILEPACTLANR